MVQIPKENDGGTTMKQYIDKSAVVAEIERRKNKLLDHIIFEHDKEWVVRTAHQLNRIILFLDTLEVKEVDKEHKDMDDKIRQYLLWLVKPLWEDTINSVGLKKDDIIAWIEKKGE